MISVYGNVFVRFDCKLNLNCELHRGNHSVPDAFGFNRLALNYTANSVSISLACLFLVLVVVSIACSERDVAEVFLEVAL